MSIDWVGLLTTSMAKEFADKPCPIALATRDADGAPHVRYVICRRVTKDGDIWFVSDSRSEKNQQLRTHAQAEAAFWLPALRQQFRIAGNVSLVSAALPDAQREQAWKQLSDAGRSLFMWPAPGQIRLDDDSHFARQTPKDAPIPNSFELLILRANQSEHLDLNPHPHLRRRWRIVNSWAEENLNP